MKKILFAATVLCMMGCQNKPTNSTPALDPSNMDTSVAPNESFYQYATGGWQAKNPLKPEHSSYNMFNVLSDNNEIRINELFTQMTKENPAKGTVNQKIADLYKLGLDSVRLNKEGAAPVKAELKTILSLDKKEQLTPILSVMQLTSSSPLFSFGPQADLKDSKVNALYIGQSGIGMGDRDYYLDAENESIREAYKTYLNRLFTLAGLEESEAGKATDAVMRIETELAKNMRSNVELRDIQRMYNPMTTADLKKNYEQKLALCEAAEALVLEPSIVEAFHKLQKLHDEWRETGPVANEFKETLWERFKEASSRINKQHQAFFENIKAEQTKNLELKAGLCEQTEELAQQLYTTRKEWNRASDLSLIHI